MNYTADDYNVTIKRGFIREDGRILWGKNPRLAGGLEWRTPEAYAKDVRTKRKGTQAIYTKHKARIAQIKLKRGCAMCGFSADKFPKKFHKHIGMLLEFDHIDPATKLHNVCDIAHYSWDVIRIEIDKCRVLCKPCHTKHTGKTNRKG